jgi:hypothetical protein
MTAAMAKSEQEPRLRRETFRTSRLLDFCSEKELIAQTGHRPAQWPLVVVKELVDNAMDAGEEAGIAPEITITVDKTGITVADNGPGIPAETVKGMLDFMEPHTDTEIGLGTIEVRDYLADVRQPQVLESEFDVREDHYPTRGPKNRFSAILFDGT